MPKIPLAERTIFQWLQSQNANTTTSTTSTTPIKPFLPSSLLTTLTLILLIHLTLRLTRYTNRLTAAADYATAYTPSYKLCWKTASHALSLVALAEHFLYNASPWGPWDATRIQHHWPGKHFLKRLLRGGVIPLEIASGGFKTYKRRGWGLSLSPRLHWPVYRQSKGRAYFYFVVLYPTGRPNRENSPAIGELNAARNRFMRNLVAQREVAVTASYYQPVPDIGRGGEQQHTWVYFDDEQLTHTKTTAMKASERDLEVGAESWCKWFLPFKKDGVLRSGTFQRRRKFGRLEADRVVTLDEFIKEQKTTVPWLSRNPYCVVRVEALDEEPARLDRWVYEEARKAKFQDIWTEDEASRAVGELYVRHGIDYQANPNFTDP